MTTATAETIVLTEPASVYHARDAVSNSRLGDFLASSRRYEALYVTRTMQPDPPKDPFKIGTALHAWSLEPGKFEETIAVCPAECLSSNGTTNTGAYRQWASEQVGKSALLKPAQWDTVKRLRRALFACPAVVELFDNAKAREQSIVWPDDATGLIRKARRDMLTSYRGHPVIADLKTTKSVSDFAGAVAEYAYYRQAAYYVDADAALRTGSPLYRGFVIIALSTEEPYRARVYEIDRKLMEVGREEILGALQRLARCYETGDWRDDEYEDRIRLIDVDDMPRWWAYRRGA